MSRRGLKDGRPVTVPALGAPSHRPSHSQTPAAFKHSTPGRGSHLAVRGDAGEPFSRSGTIQALTRLLVCKISTSSVVFLSSVVALCMTVTGKGRSLPMVTCTRAGRSVSSGTQTLTPAACESRSPLAPRYLHSSVYMFYVYTALVCFRQGRIIPGNKSSCSVPRMPSQKDFPVVCSLTCVSTSN